MVNQLHAERKIYQVLSISDKVEKYELGQVTDILKVASLSEIFQSIGVFYGVKHLRCL